MRRPNPQLLFWDWMRYGSGGKPGYKTILDRWIFIHLIIGVILGFAVPKSLTDAAVTILVPLAGVFVGMAFAWAGNAQALLQTDEIKVLAKNHAGGLRQYVFTYQLAVLVLLLTLSFWGLAGLGIFEKIFLSNHHPDAYRIVSVFLYGLSSYSLRECWHVVAGAQLLLLSRADIADRATFEDASTQLKENVHN